MSNITGKYCYEYPHAAMTADCVIFGFDGRTLNVLLVERGGEPYKGMWALPGGFMHIDETIDECASRELREETNLHHVYLEQFRVFSSVDRDPRERVVTVAYIALVRPSDYQVIAGDDAVKAMWFNESMLPPLAFDHDEIIRAAREYLSEVIRIKPIAFALLDEMFTVAELQRVYETINRTTYDRRNFLRKAMHSGAIAEAPEVTRSVVVNSNVQYCMSPPMCMRKISDMDVKSCGQLSMSDDSDDFACDSAPQPCAEPAPEPRQRRSKLFFFRGRKKDKENPDDSSMKDIFNF